MAQIALKEVLFHVDPRGAMKEEAKLTLKYYEENAQSFCLDTQDVDFSIFQLEFMKGLPMKGRENTASALSLPPVKALQIRLS